VTVPDPRRWLVLAVVGAAFFMTILDVSIVNVALPTIGEDLGFSGGDLQWVLTAYGLTFGGFLLLGGRAADLLGRRRVFMVGVLLFSLASLVCGLATSDTMLIGARAVQGLGAAIISPAALSIVSTTFTEGADRTKALGIWGALGGSGAAVGVLLGGILTKYLGWEWIFFVNVPVGALVLVAATRIIRESRVETTDRQYDPFGALTITGGLALLVYALSRAPYVGWGTARTIGLLIASGVLIAAFLVIERRVHRPLMPFDIFRVRTVKGANIVGFLLGAVVFANFFLLTLYVQDILHFSALKAGITFLATAGTAVLAAGVAQGLVTKVGVKPVLATGLALLTLGMLWYTQIPVDGSYASDLLPGYLLVGVGLAFAFVPVSIAALSGVSHDEAGLASGLINTAQQIGGAMGVALASTVFTNHLGTGQPTLETLTDAYAQGFWLLAGFAALGLLATLVFIRKGEVTAPAVTGETVQEGAGAGG
jgi:EmrB/QacA subfamily drug resistance transporter